LSYLGQPHRSYEVIHIAGTNGKGSVSAIVSQVLTAAGYRTGLFTSPHLHFYGERIRIDQKPIDDVELWSLIGEIKPGIRECEKQGHGTPTEFEILTALAFTWFERQRVDIAVIETGMGGTYDSTNVVSPVVAAITNVALDHLQYLGPGLKDVARNKAGIIKPGVPLVYGGHHPVVDEIIYRTCKRLNSPLCRARDAEITVTADRGLEGCVLDFSAGGYEARGVAYSLAGSFQIENLATALMMLDQVNRRGLTVSLASITSTLPRLRWPGRMERVSRDPEVIVDAAHNLHGAGALAQALDRIYPERNRVLVTGILDDKDGTGMLKRLAPGTRCCIITRPDGARGENWRMRYEEALRLINRVRAVEDIEEAVDQALKEVQPGEYVLITGSFMTLDRARRMFTQT